MSAGCIKWFKLRKNKTASLLLFMDVLDPPKKEKKNKILEDTKKRCQSENVKTWKTEK